MSELDLNINPITVVYAAEYAKPFLLETWKTLLAVIQAKIIHNKDKTFEKGLQNIESFTTELAAQLNKLENRFDSLEELVDCLEEASTHPNFYYLLNSISLTAFRTGKAEKHRILADLLVDKIYFGIEENPMIDKAIETIPYLSVWDLHRLGLLYIITSYQYKNPVEQASTESVTDKLEAVFLPYENTATRMYEIDSLISNGLFIPRPDYENEALDWILMRIIENNDLKILTDRFYLDPINDFIKKTEVGMKLQSAFAIIKKNYALSSSGKIIGKLFHEIMEKKE